MLIIYVIDNNLALQQDLYRLRTEAQAAFDEAKSLERRWSDLEREQREVYQVLSFLLNPYTINLQESTALHTPIPLNAPPTRNNSPRRHLRSTRVEFRAAIFYRTYNSYGEGG